MSLKLASIDVISAMNVQVGEKIMLEVSLSGKSTTVNTIETIRNMSKKISP